MHLLASLNYTTALGERGGEGERDERRERDTDGNLRQFASF